jgi:hypothetical protein
VCAALEPGRKFLEPVGVVVRRGSQADLRAHWERG